MTDQMDTVIVPSGPCTGQVTIPASKSRAHRLLICAALSEAESEIICHGISRDIQATADCLRGMGVDLTQQEHRFLIHRPLSLSARSDREAVLPCGESGSTLRFLLPVVGALGIPAAFRMEGRLPERPMDPLTKVLSEHGMQFLRSSPFPETSLPSLFPGCFLRSPCWRAAAFFRSPGRWNLLPISP